MFITAVPIYKAVRLCERRRCVFIKGTIVCVYYCRTFYKAVRVGEEESGGHVL